MKKTVIIILVVILSLFVLGIVKDQIIGAVVSGVATQVTGARVTIGGMSVGILRHSVRINDFKMYNPKGFSNNILVDLPKVVVNYDLFSIIRGKLHLSLVDVHLREVGLEKNKEGKLNVDSLKVAEKEPAKEEKEKKPAKPLQMQIDVLNVQMGRIVSKDYSQNTQEPSVQVYELNIKKSYKNITSAQQLVALILTESMKQAGIRSAGIYGAAMLTGVGFVPIVAISALTGKDSAQQTFNRDISRVYDKSLAVLKRIGKVNSADKTSAVISGEAEGANITIKLEAVSSRKTEITVSARSFFMPKPEIASGVMYRIAEELK